MPERKNESQNNDSSAFLPVAITFLVLGISTENFAFIGVSLFFFIVAISEGDESKADMAAPDEARES